MLLSDERADLLTSNRQSEDDSDDLNNQAHIQCDTSHDLHSKDSLKYDNVDWKTF